MFENVGFEFFEECTTGERNHVGENGRGIRAAEIGRNGETCKQKFIIILFTVDPPKDSDFLSPNFP